MSYFNQLTHRLIISYTTITIINALLALISYPSWKIYASIVTGNIIAYTAFIIFTQRCFKHFGAQAARQILYDFYHAEMLKIVLITLSFAIILSLNKYTKLGLQANIMLISFAISYLLNIITTFIIVIKQHN